MKATLLAALTFVGAAFALAQDPEQLVPIDPASAAAPAPVYVPLTIKQKYIYSIEEIFGPDRLVGLAAHATLDQMGVRPVQWGKRPSSLAIRFASYFGDSLLKHNIEFGVRALDHEDPRYFRLGRGRPWTRVGHAVVHTFVVRSDYGGWMPAYSLPVDAVPGADVAAGAVSDSVHASSRNSQRGHRNGSQYPSGVLAGHEERAASLVHAHQPFPAPRR